MITSRAQHCKIQLLLSSTSDREVNAFDFTIWPYPSSIALSCSAFMFNISAGTYHGELPEWWYRELTAAYPPRRSWASSTHLQQVLNSTTCDPDHLGLDKHWRSWARKNIPCLSNFSIATKAKRRASESSSWRDFTRDPKAWDALSPEEPRN
jgi:hypothetical protein